MIRWEAVRCSNIACRREFVRAALGEDPPACGECHCEMIVVALQDVEPSVDAIAPCVDRQFTLSDARSTLEWVISREQALVDPVGPASSWHAGRAAAFSEALEIVVAVARHQAADSPGLFSPTARPEGRITVPQGGSIEDGQKASEEWYAAHGDPAVSVSDPLRTDQGRGA